MQHNALNIRRIDSRRDDIRAAMAELRRRLSPRGNVVSEAGRQRTIEVFGEPLSPAQVVERICRDVSQQGLAAVLDYSARIDKAAADGRDDPRAGGRVGRRPTPRPIRELLGSGPPRARQHPRRSRRRSCTATSGVERPGGYLVQRYRPLDRVGICVPGGAAAYPSTVLMTAVPAQVAGVEGTGRRRPADEVRRLQRRPAGHLPRVGHHRGLSARRRPGRGRAGLRRRGHSARRQDRRAGQPVRRAGQEATSTARWTSTRSPGPARWW